MRPQKAWRKGLERRFEELSQQPEHPEPGECPSSGIHRQSPLESRDLGPFQAFERPLKGLKTTGDQLFGGFSRPF